MPPDATVEVIDIDITTLDVDAIVNAAHRGLSGGGGVDGAIHRAAGPRLVEASMKLAPCPTGSARITPGFGLKARFVIHAVGPIWRGGAQNEEALLAAAYRTSMRLAVDAGCRSIAFPAISCGVYGFPMEPGAAIAVRTVREELETAPGIARVIFAVRGPVAEAAFRAALAEGNA